MVSTCFKIIYSIQRWDTHLGSLIQDFWDFCSRYFYFCLCQKVVSFSIKTIFSEVFTPFYSSSAWKLLSLFLFNSEGHFTKSFFICHEEVIRSPTLSSLFQHEDCPCFARKLNYRTFSCMFCLARGDT